MLNPYIVKITPPIEKWHGTARGGAGRGDYHHIVVSYYHIIILSYYHIIILSYYHYRKRRYGYSHFWLQVSLKNTNWIFYPLTKGRREKINELQAITFQGASASDAQTSVAPPKYRVIDFAPKFFWKIFAKKKFFGVEKSNVGNRLKRVFPKFESDRSHPRGVNGRSKFSKLFASSKKIACQRKNRGERTTNERTNERKSLQAAIINDFWWKTKYKRPHYVVPGA